MNVKKHKPTITLVAAICLMVVGCGLLIAGFVIPPSGEIHNSVLVAFGEILTFVGAVFGMKYHYQFGDGLANNSSDSVGRRPQGQRPNADSEDSSMYLN